ncbi:MAG: CHAT domain-containing protein, partial [Chloroflexi bacterium]|nr:CHAT domain-containing protein [Chloroflexota bacterium]
MAQDTTITLTIGEADSPPTFLFDVWHDDHLLVTNHTLSAADSRAVRDVSQRYNALFEQRGRPKLTADNLQALGSTLFDLWLAPVWDRVQAAIRSGSSRSLVVASDCPTILNLPWELLRLPDGTVLGFDTKYGIRRLPRRDRLDPFAGVLPPRPLRILFMACAPEDQAPLDYEREEKVVLEAVARAGPNVVFDSCDLGTFEELRDRIIEFQPQIVHLTGHGTIKDGQGHFAFEDEEGKTDLRSSEEIRQDLFAGSGVQCAFISGCQTGKAPPVAAIGGICQGLVSEEVPLAMGWAASIADDVAIQFTETLYRTLALGQMVNQALTQARRSIKRVCEERGDPSWTLPVLYAATTQRLVHDTDMAHPAIVPRRTSMVQQALPGMTEGYTDYFVGRRREIQKLLPALREGRIRVLLLTGLGGAGKSTLATRLARKLQTDGFIPIPSSQDAPLSAARLLELCRPILLRANLREEHATLGDA